LNPPSSLSLSENERIARIQLYRCENVGPVTFFDLMNRYKTAENALEALPELARRGGKKRPLKICSKQNVMRELDEHKKHNARLIVWGDQDYPKMLKTVSDTSPILSVKGNIALAENKAIAIVGARNSSINGKKFAKKLSYDLGREGFIMISGLARGIDKETHEGALESGTIAVIAGGIDHIYPPENESLYHAIAEKGLIISETPIGVKPQASYFPRRNRLISGLSLGTIVVEAAFQSGSLITAKYAADQGREVFVVPGSPLDPRCKGSNKLIRDGATLIQSAQDVMDSLPLTIDTAMSEPSGIWQYDSDYSHRLSTEDLDKIQEDIITQLSPTPIVMDELIRQCDVSGSIVLMILLELELAGKVQRHPGNQVSLSLEWSHGAEQ